MTIFIFDQTVQNYNIFENSIFGVVNLFQSDFWPQRDKLAFLLEI